MPDTSLTPQAANGHAPAGPPEAAGPSRHLSYLTWECSVELNYEALTELMDETFDLWDRAEAAGTTKVIGDGFEDLIAHIARLREYTGWGGVPGIYTGGEVNP